MLVVGASAAIPAGAVASTACAGATAVSWTGAGDGHSWSDAANWGAGTPPTSTSNVTVAVAGSAIDGVTGDVCDLVLTGGADAAGTVALDGSLTVAGDATLSGSVRLGAAGGASSYAVHGALVTQPGTDLTLLDGTAVEVPGSALLGATTVFHRPAGATGAAPRLVVSGVLKLAGAASIAKVDLDLVDGPTTSGTVDVNSAVLTLSGPSTSRWVAGAVVKGVATGAAGAVEVADEAALDLGSTLTVNSGATLRLKTGSKVTTSSGSATVTGTGTGGLAWDAGTLDGTLTLNVLTAMDTAGTRTITAGSALTNLGQLTVKAGTVVADGSLVNKGQLRLFPGTLVTRNAATAYFLDNDSGNPASPAILAVGASDTAAGSGSTSVRLVKVPLRNRNNGIVTVVAGEKLVLSGDVATPTQSELDPGSRLRDPFTPPATSPPPPGRLIVAGGARLGLAGTTTLEGKAVLALDDGFLGGGGDGTKAALLATAGSAAKLAGASASAGAVHWRSGTVVGPLTIDKIELDVGANTAESRRILATGDPAATALTLAGPASVNATTVLLEANAKVLIAGTTKIASAPGGFHRSTSTVTGQSVTVALGGTLQRVASATTPGGSTTSSGAATIDVPVVNHGTVSLETTLNVPAGYTQVIQPGAAATAAKPVTGLFGSSSGISASLALSSADGAGHWAPITLTHGGLGGKGVVEANPLAVGTTWIHPGTSTTAGKLTVKGPLKLSGGTEVQIVVRGTAADQHDTLEVAPLTWNGAVVAPGTAYLNGRVTGLTASGYTPAYLASVPNVLQFAARSGSFATASWSGTPVGLGWKPLYDDSPTDGDPRAVDLRLVDVAPPALGIASIPAFTQLTSQRFTYAAVDNKTGVASYDVRWIRAYPTTGFSAWVYPSTWQRTTSTSRTLSGLAQGYTYCFSVRARDKAGNTSAWSSALCTAKMFDDRALTASSGWYRPSGKSGFYAGTYSRSTTYGAKLTRYGGYTRLAVTAYRCPTCGVLNIYSGSTLLKSLNLYSSRSGLTTWVSAPMSRRTNTVTLRVGSRNKPVIVDSFGMLR